jgi:16S rRNA (guanine(966)-N(2))-methyltransferase RsmD
MSALFNILASAGLAREARFLDLFSGTGAAAIEALRRGAESALCVESDRRQAEAIKSELARLGLSDRAKCLRMDARAAIPALLASGEAFGAVFADPPYDAGWGRELPAIMAANWRVVAPGGVFVFERSSRETPDDIFISRDDRIYGETVLSFYWKNFS